MEPIQQLLNRIRWDDEFGAGIFEIGIFDRIEDAVELHYLETLRFEKGNHFSFTAHVGGEEVSIPFHRIREVRKNGECIWKR